ncbi:transcriptional regulator [Bifidobacterium ramosum]|uniref:Transcriptional regulator n=1 Tax=Bifidobacterium ramosum TaxID=1798158 RepID=A0A6L4WXA8_9BIFI|nr:Lrp/AsnC family transcriptional regulator [Bifidobacterium ramosum]KAB8286757.1 transcriptional regulator [Bifidobacterium ramosum]NEG72757.1 AsnC family transcriptional regulator [Bifidobacterium ramosum]
MTEQTNGDGESSALDIHGLLEVDYPPATLDDTDRRLLMLMNEDSSRSQRSLAGELGISAPTVAERIQRLQRLHVIERKGIIANHSALGYPILVVMPMSIEQDANPARIVTALREIPLLTELLLLTGSYDMMARFMVRDHKQLQWLLLERVWSIPGLRHVETMISLGSLCSRDQLDVALGDGVDN